MWKYQEPGFTGYKKPNVLGQPCTVCGKPSVYKGRKLCYAHGSARDFKSRLKRGQVKQTLRHNDCQAKLDKIRLIQGDVVMPVIRKSDKSKGIGGFERAGTDYTQGCIGVRSANSVFVKTRDKQCFDRNHFKFRLIYRAVI